VPMDFGYSPHYLGSFSTLWSGAAGCTTCAARLTSWLFSTSRTSPWCISVAMRVLGLKQQPKLQMSNMLRRSPNNDDCRSVDRPTPAKARWLHPSCSLHSSNAESAARVRRTIYPTLRDSLQPTPTCTQVDAHDYHPVGRPNFGSRLSLQVLSGQRL
jgi:hypothetical protein